MPRSLRSGQAPSPLHRHVKQRATLYIEQNHDIMGPLGGLK